MSNVRDEEEWAARCIRAALGRVEVRRNDDGSEAGMFDLRIVYPDRPFGAVEVTAAADAESTELWNITNGRRGRWQVDQLAGGWFVSLVPSARAKRVLAELPRLLSELERRGIRRLEADAWHGGRLEGWAQALGVSRAGQGDTDFPGSVYLTIELPSERSGGFVGDSGDPLARWVGEWLRGPRQRDNLEKLLHSGATECHVFVILPGFSLAPFEVADLLWRDDAPLPTAEPDLPDAVTHVWAVSTWNAGAGMRWSSGRGWERFDKHLSA